MKSLINLKPKKQCPYCNQYYWQKHTCQSKKATKGITKVTKKSKVCTTCKVKIPEGKEAWFEANPYCQKHWKIKYDERKYSSSVPYWSKIFKKKKALVEEKKEVEKVKKVKKEVKVEKVKAVKEVKERNHRFDLENKYKRLLFNFKKSEKVIEELNRQLDERRK